ncbi:MAG: phosphomannomutase/phosphoglucomutase [Nitrospirota bacterium]
MSIYREYDIRGVVGRDLTFDVVERIGVAYGTTVRRSGGSKVAIGRDVRDHSMPIRDRLAAGITSAGVHVVDLDVCPTPLLYYSLFHLAVDGGVMITGSHNPPEFNGLKMCVGREAIYGDAIQLLRRLVESGERERGQGTRSDYAIISPYLKEVTGQFVERVKAHDRRPLRVVVDSGNGVAGLVAPALLRAIGCDVIELYSEPDARFPHHHPDPTVLDNLRDLIAAVARHRADLGIAYDGDADRIGVVDERGDVLWGDRLLALLAGPVLVDHPGAPVIAEAKCSQVLYDEIARRGGKAVMWKTGHSLIKARMKELGAPLAGEMSGHLFFADRYYGFDDAMYASCRVVELLVREGRPLSALAAALPTTVVTPEIRMDCPDEQKFGVVARVQTFFRDARTKPGAFPLPILDVIDVDGVRVRMPHGWGLVRASNTQPVLVLRFESDTEAHLSEIRSAMESRVKECWSAS